ncbi:Cysteine--tRNA ligase, partial [Bienertia sinuspersici]
PPVNHVKVNVDAHVGNNRVVGLGVVIWDHCGKTQVSAVYKIVASWKAEVVEARAALYGIQVALRLGYPRMVLESDSIQVRTTIMKEARGHPQFSYFLMKLGN